MSTPDPALLDTDVASVLYRARLFQRVVPAGLVGVVADRPLAISAITLGEASYGALSRKWSARRTAEMLAFYANSFGVVDLGRAVAIEYGRLRAATEALGRPVASNDLWIAASATANGLSLARHPQPTALRATYLARSAAAVTAVHSAEHHGCHERETASGTAGRRHVEVGTLELRCAALPARGRTAMG